MLEKNQQAEKDSLFKVYDHVGKCVPEITEESDF